MNRVSVNVWRLKSNVFWVVCRVLLGHGFQDIKSSYLHGFLEFILCLINLFYLFYNNQFSISVKVLIYKAEMLFIMIERFDSVFLAVY